MGSKALFILEGEDREPRIIESLQNTFFGQNSLTSIHCSFGNDIYELYKEIVDIDEYEEVNIVGILKNLGIEINGFNYYKMSDFSEIYLFFDHDGHDDQANDEKLKAMLSLFNNETEAGKLYINYPMVESFRDIGDGDFRGVVQSIDKNTNYKNDVHNRTKYHMNLSRYDRSLWTDILREHLRKANFLTKGLYLVPEKDTPDQLSVLNKQVSDYINARNEVAVLSSFTSFIDYYFLERYNPFSSSRGT